MRRAVVFPVLAFGTLLLAGEPSSSSSPLGNARGMDWVMHLFDKDGHRSMSVRAGEGQPAGDGFAVKDLNVTTYTGEAAPRVDAVLLSAAATFLPKTKRAHGDGPVRLIRDDLEVSGNGWDYEHADKHLVIRHDVRVVFHESLKIRL